MSYIDSLEQTLYDWKNKPIEDEWLFEKFRETEISNLETFEAYDFINETVPFLLDKENLVVWTELFETIISLARRSKTTEMPSGIFENWDEIKEIAHQHSDYAKCKFEELATYYRIE